MCQSRTVCKKGFPPWRRESFAVYLVVVSSLSGVAGDLGLDELLLDLRQTSTGGDELTDDDVLLQAGQRVDLALDGGFGQDTGGLLEGCSGQEGVGSQTGLGDAKQDSGCLGEKAQRKLYILQQ